MKQKEQLLEKALKARENSYSPSSTFKVGASILGENGQVFVGCNVENASHPCGQCAEASAIGNMVSHAGAQKIEAVCVVADVQEGVFPCGNCLQRIAEFADSNTTIYCASLDGIQQTYTLDDLFPVRFSKHHLG